MPRKNITSSKLTIMPVLDTNELIMLIYIDKHDKEPEISISMTYDQAITLWETLGQGIDAKMAYLEQMLAQVVKLVD